MLTTWTVRANPIILPEQSPVWWNFRRPTGSLGRPDGAGAEKLLGNSAKGLTAPWRSTWPDSPLKTLNRTEVNDVSAFEASKGFWAYVPGLRAFYG